MYGVTHVCAKDGYMQWEEVGMGFCMFTATFISY